MSNNVTNDYIQTPAISIVLKVLGWITVDIGLILGTWLALSYDKNFGRYAFELKIALPYWIGGIMASMLLFVSSKLIELFNIMAVNLGKIASKME